MTPPPPPAERTPSATARGEAAAREFEPAGTPALYVRDPERAAAAKSENRRRAAEADPMFAGLLGHGDEADDWDDAAPFDTLVLNTLNPVVQALPSLDRALVADVVRHLYATAVLASGPSTSGWERDLLSDSLLSLIERAR